MGTAGTKMPTTGVPSLRCRTKLSGWLGGAHPTVEDGEFTGRYAFVIITNFQILCKDFYKKNCSSYLVYKLHQLSDCPMRHCATDRL